MDHRQQMLETMHNLGPDQVDECKCDVCGNNTFLEHLSVFKVKAPLLMGLPPNAGFNKKVGLVCTNCNIPLGVTKEQVEEMQKQQVFEQYSMMTEEERSQLPENVRLVMEEMYKKQNPQPVVAPESNTTEQTNVLKFEKKQSKSDSSI